MFFENNGGRTKVRQASDKFYQVLQYARLVICFSEDKSVGGLKYARLVIGLIEYYTTLGR